jgi:hypothetical protein
LWTGETESIVRSILERRNRGLLRDVHALIILLDAAPIPTALAPYRQRILVLCQEQDARIQRSLLYLSLGAPSILPDVLSATNLAIGSVGFLSTQLATPVLRAKESDALCLWTIEWLHEAHPQTAGYPPAMCDGDVAVLPLVDFLPIYFFPAVEQRGLLFQPLLFHEFGHLLYARHKPELDDLVGELQRAVEEALLPASQRNDRHAQQQAAQRRRIVRIWYRWAQELFCDAVGFEIGGPSFLQAFATFLSRLDVSDYTRRPEQLGSSPHPITALRVHFLARRASAAGFGQLASRVTGDWEFISRALGVTTDYYGFYDDALESAIDGAMDDMLTEVEPRRFADHDLRQTNPAGGWESPVVLFNAAWRVHEADPAGYPAWEAHQLGQMGPPPRSS